MSGHKNKGTGGFEEKWITAVEEYMCPVCLLVAREAVACACGALFCEDCRAICTSCPNCRSKDSVAPSFRDRRAIQNLNVACPLGCSVVFRLGDHSSHVQRVCANRIVPCPSCQTPTPLSYHPQHLETVCAHRQVRCDGCTVLVSLPELPKHKQEACPQRNVTCSLCSDVLRAENWEPHLATGHMKALLDRIMSLESTVQQLQADSSSLRARLQEEGSKPKDSSVAPPPANWPEPQNGRPHLGKYMVCGSGGCSTHERFLNGHCDPLKRMNGNKPIGLWSCCGVLDNSIPTCGGRSLVGMYPLFSWRQL